MKKHAIIVAGGSGTRMKSEVPKQFIELDHKPIIVHTLEQFIQIDSIHIVLVLPSTEVGRWKKMETQFFGSREISVAFGGSTRSESVLAGLNLVDEGLVAIHDAVRPFISKKVIEESFQSAEKFGSGVAAVKLKDSIREIGSPSSKACDREDFVLVQTPQTFRVHEIKEAYSQTGDSFSDDATVFEQAGYMVNLIQGDYANIKITTPEDLK